MPSDIVLSLMTMCGRFSLIGRFGLAPLALTGTLFGPAGAEARAMEARPVVAIECRAAEAHLPGACRALKKALRRAAPGTVQRVMDDLSQAPRRPGDLALALRAVTGSEATRLRLEWRGASGEMRQGPSCAIGPGADAGRVIETLLSAGPDFF